MDPSVDRNRLALNLRRGLLVLPLVFLALFYFYPLASILGVSFAPEGQLDLSALTGVGRFIDTIGFTLAQAVLSTVLTLALALPAAYVFARYRFRGRSLLLALATLAFVLPTVVVATAFKALIGPRGLLNLTLMQWFGLEQAPIQLDNTLAIILIAHVFYNFAVALRIITAYWINQSPRIDEAARILGARGWRLWWHIRLPLLRPAITAAAVLVFIFTFTSFGVILILGGPRYATLEVEIYQQTVNFLNLPLAAVLSLIQILMMLMMMWFYTRLQRRNASDLQAAAARAQKPRSAMEHVQVGLVVSFMSVLLLMPLLALAIRAITGEDGLTLRYFLELSRNARGSALFVPPTQAIGNSLVFAVVTTLLTTVLGLITVHLLATHQRLDPLFMLPLATSAVTLGFGFIIALDQPPLNLRSSPILIPIAHTLVALPFMVRSLLPAYQSIASNIRESGHVLGASPWQVWRWIDLPLMSRGLIVGAIFAFTISMGEFGASLFIARPDTPTIPIVIYRLLGQPMRVNLGQAEAMSVILMLVCGLSFIAIERLREAGIGEF